MGTFKAVTAHALELAVVLVVAYVVTSFFKVDNEMYTAILALVFGALTKFARASATVPVPDYTR